MNKQLIFLLGGHDLEMNVIANILKEQCVCYRDHSLEWHNAKLSQYKEDLHRYGNNPAYHIYGIELQEDCLLPDNYTRIDHHNDYVDCPSALEQVAAVLGLSLTRYQQLVAANDKGYIPGMKEIGATPEEIICIRLEDRKAQGVSDEDELLAKKAIRENKVETANLILIRAFTSRFSPICDRLYPYARLLIYTDREVGYYGKGVAILKEKFENELLLGNMFCGGGNEGYLGTKQDAYSFSDLELIIKQIKQYIS